MSVTNFLPTMRRLVQMVIVAGLYYLTARLGFLMALPPAMLRPVAPSDWRWQRCWFGVGRRDSVFLPGRSLLILGR
jgi:hypothetical protein